MTRLRLKYIDDFVDRTGRPRFYFRRKGGPRIALRGMPGSDQFMADYAAALTGQLDHRAAPRKKGREAVQGGERSIDKLLDAYFKSPEYVTMKPGTRTAYRRVFTRWVESEGIGHRPVDGLRREHINLMISKRADTPGAANDLLKKIRLLMSFAIRLGWRETDPTTKMKKFKGTEWHTWNEDEIAAYVRRWPSGTPERLAFALLLYTGQRVSDVALMRWSDVERGRIAVVQEKTGGKVFIPIHPLLAGELAGADQSAPALMVTSFGKPFSIKGLSNWMAARIDEAGLPERCITHGLRKAAARRMAEAGCSAKQIASITGHKSLAEVERYVREAEQAIMAEDAIERVSSSPRFQTGRAVPNRAQKAA